jgi:hypothetical protein
MNKNIFKKITGNREFGVVIALIVMIVIFAFSTEIFMTVDNLLNITRQISIISLIAIGMTFVIITGGIDLSVGSIIIFAGIIYAASCMMDFNLPIAVACWWACWWVCLRRCERRADIVFEHARVHNHYGHDDHTARAGILYTGAYPHIRLPQEFKLMG